MPIVKILPDGKVRIVNTKSGEVKDVPPEELKKYAPRLVADYQTLITSGEVAKAGATPETSDPVKLALQAQQIQSGTYKAPMSSAVQKRSQQLNQAAPMLQNVATEAEKAPTGALGWALSQLGKIPGVEGGQAELLRRDNEGFARLIAGVFAGESGVATDKDVQRWQSLLPQPGDTSSERKDRLRKLAGQVNTEAKGLGIDTPQPILDLLNSSYLTEKKNPVNSLIDKYFPKK